MNERILDTARAYIEKYRMIASGDTVVAGVSGGADSVCLLYLLHTLSKELSFRLLAVHVNHGIREEAAQDAAFTGKLCRELSVPFFLIKEDVQARAKREKLSEEEAGRSARYEAFDRVLREQARGPGRIAVAHNANDRVETMLFHLFRGTGLAGAGGIPPVRDKIIRPLLAVTRQEIEAFLHKKEIPYCIDRTNLVDTYTRNRIRNRLLPFVEQEICRGASAHLWEAADLFLETKAYVERQAAKAYWDCVTEEAGAEDVGAGEAGAEDAGAEDADFWEHRKENCQEDTFLTGKQRICLKADALLRQDPVIRGQILLQCLEKLSPGRRDISSAHIKAIRGLLTKNGTSRVSLPGGLTARKEYNRLFLEKKPDGRRRKEEGRTETGRTETGRTDAGRTDAGRTDAGRTDAGRTETGRTDAGRTDAGRTETGRTDAGRTETGRTDAGRTDIGRTDTGKTAPERTVKEGPGSGLWEPEIPVQALPDLPVCVAVPGLGKAEISLFFYEKSQIIPQNTYTKWFDYDKITKSAVFRKRRQGDYLTVNAALQKKSLKEYMINEKIPADQRTDLYVLADGSHILWVPGYRISHYYKVSESTKRILAVRIRGGR